MVRKQPNYKLHTLYALTTAFIIVFGLHILNGKLALWNPETSESNLRNTFRGDSVRSATVAWGVIALVLFSAAAFDSTAPLAAAFAWLILISVILINTDRIVAIANKQAPSGGPYLGGSIGGSGGGIKKP